MEKLSKKMGMPDDQIKIHKKEFEDNIKGLSKEEAIKACTMQSAFLNMAERWKLHAAVKPFSQSAVSGFWRHSQLALQANWPYSKTPQTRAGKKQMIKALCSSMLCMDYRAGAGQTVD